MQPIGRLGKIGVWFLVVAQSAVLAPQVVGEPLLLNLDCCQPAPATSGPAVWGFVGLRGYPTGKREAPNGFAFDPSIGLTSDFNVGIEIPCGRRTKERVCYKSMKV